MNLEAENVTCNIKTAACRLDNKSLAEPFHRVRIHLVKKEMIKLEDVMGRSVLCLGRDTRGKLQMPTYSDLTDDKNMNASIRGRMTINFCDNVLDGAKGECLRSRRSVSDALQIGRGLPLSRA